MIKGDLTFSVIIPLFNKEDFVCDALDSLLQQQILPNEIILVNDCSTDNGFELAKSFASSSKFPELFIFLENETNSGPGITRNHGIQKARSEYVLFLDADDKLAPSHIYNLNQCISLFQSKLILCKVLQTTSSRILPTNYIYNHSERKSESFTKINNPLAILEKEMIFVSANYCFQKSYFEGITFSSERNFEDWLFCYHLIKKLELGNEFIWLMEEATYLYAEDDPSSLSSKVVTDIHQFVIPQLYFELHQDHLVEIRKYIFSIWFFNAMKRIAGFARKLRFIWTHKTIILTNFSFNKYYLSSFIAIFINRNQMETLIKQIKKAT